MDLIAAGGSFEYHYPNEQDAASLWYHDHAHGRTSRTLYHGLLAMYVLEDDVERELDLPRGEYDVPIVIADHAFNRDGSFRYADSIDIGFRGDTILVNGVVSPRMRVKRRKYRLRFLNASNARSYSLRLGRGRVMTQIAGDGGLLERPVRRRQIPLHPAERVDLVIDFGDYGPGTELVLHNDDGEGGTVAVMRFDVARGGGREDFRVPRRLRELERLPRAAADSALGAGARAASVADQRQGVRPRPDRRAAAPRQHRALDLRQSLEPRASDAHPRVPVPDPRAQQRPRPSRPTASAGRTRSESSPTRRSRVLAWFAPYSGRYVFHCHALEHADQAMMLQLEVVAMRWVLRHRRGARRCAPSAYAHGARSRPSTTPSGRRHRRTRVTIKVGETVTWRFARTAASAQRESRHIQLEPTRRTVEPATPVRTRSLAAGVYEFVCRLPRGR